MSACAIHLPQAPLLTILLPVFNEEEEIGSVISSLTQLCKERGIDHEILVIDNGSVDNTGSLLALLEHKLPSVRLHSLSRRIGWGAAIREGMRRSLGRYVLLCGVKEAARALSQHPEEAFSRALHLLEGGYDLVITEPREGEESLRGMGAGLLALLKKGLPSFLGSRSGAPLVFVERERGCDLAEGLRDVARGEIELLSLARERKHRVAELIHPPSTRK